MIGGSFLRSRRNLVLDDRGAAAVEFALIVPVLILLYAVGFEIAEAATVKRKLTDTTVQLANVASQDTKTTKADVAILMSAASQIMTPYSTNVLSMQVAEIYVDNSGTPHIQWTESYLNGTPLQGTLITTPPSAPPSFKTANSYYIDVQTTYLYYPIVGTNFIHAMTLSNQSFALPRNSSSIPCPDCDT